VPKKPLMLGDLHVPKQQVLGTFTQFARAQEFRTDVPSELIHPLHAQVNRTQQYSSHTGRARRALRPSGCLRCDC
jgi:hypothetical protein